MTWLWQLSRMIWTSRCRRRDSVKNLASAANGSGVSEPSASLLNVGHYRSRYKRKKKKKCKLTVELYLYQCSLDKKLFLGWAFSHPHSKRLFAEISSHVLKEYILKIHFGDFLPQNSFNQCHLVLLAKCNLFVSEAKQQPDEHNRRDEPLYNETKNTLKWMQCLQVGDEED